MLRNTVIALILILLLPALVTAQESEEPRLELLILEDGQEIEGMFAGSVTAHLYAFNGSAGDMVTIEMTQDADSTLDPLIVLLGSAGQVIASDDDSGEIPLASLISEVELPEDGTYFILATSFSYIRRDVMTEDELGDGLSYTLSMSGATLPENEEIINYYYQSEVSIGDSVEGYSNADEPVYFFTFLGTEGDVITVEQASDDIDTLLYLFSPNGDRLAVNDDDPGNGTDSALRNIALPMDGEYLIFATTFGFHNYTQTDEAAETYEGGNFELSLSAGE